MASLASKLAESSGGAESIRGTNARTVRRTKIVATLGPASNAPATIKQLVQAGMDVARLNFSHGKPEEHERNIANLRAVSAELDTPVTILQDLQGPKVRVGELPGGEITLTRDAVVSMVPEADFSGQPDTIPLDYAFAAEEAREGMQVLLADGIFELEIIGVEGRALRCRVVEGGVLKNRKGVNFPNLNLRLPSLTEKDIQDLEFGIAHDIDWISLSFVRTGADVRMLKDLLTKKGVRKPVMAKIEKPQAVENLEDILAEVDGIMVARGDLGVEMSPERVPMLQKHIIERCNRKGVPVITATQMLESMTKEPRPTRAEASDVANAIIDGTDAVMLSAETAVGEFPIRAVEMMARIARDVEAGIEFKNYRAPDRADAQALTEAARIIAQDISPRGIVVLTTSGHTARCIAAERPKAPVVAITTSIRVYHELNLVWGIKPLLVHDTPRTFEELVQQAEDTLRARQLVSAGHKLLVMGGVPAGQPRGSNFLKIHTVA